ncbi:hypothetical protein AHAS_Ahas07G0033000 [Arachis hypogaea]
MQSLQFVPPTPRDRDDEFQNAVSPNRFDSSKAYNETSSSGFVLVFLALALLKPNERRLR